MLYSVFGLGRVFDWEVDSKFTEKGDLGIFG